MPKFSGKTTKTSSDSKRHFTVVMGNKEHGLYVSSTPSSAARKAATKLCSSNKSKKVEFHIREITQGSKKKVYGPYIGYIVKLKESIELKGRVIKYKPIAKLKKGGMKGGEGIDDIILSKGNCGREKKFSLTNPFKKCIVLSYNNRKITINYDEKIKQIIVKYFDNIDTNIYYNKENYSVTQTNLPIFSEIIKELLNQPEVFLDQSQCLSLIDRIKIFIDGIPNSGLEFTMINNWLNQIIQTKASIPLMVQMNHPKVDIEQSKIKENNNLSILRQQIKANRQRENAVQRQRLQQVMNMLSGSSEGLMYRKNWSKQPSYTSYTLPPDNPNFENNNR